MFKSNSNLNAKDQCPTCFSTIELRFLEISDVPVHIGLLWSSKESAKRCPKGNIILGYCHHCNFVTNLTFEPSLLEYTQAYENSLDFSPSFQNYAYSLALRLIGRYGLFSKNLIEIGCGKGNFLRTLCELGGNRGVGFDPSYESEIDDSISKDICFIKKFYSDYHSDLRADFILCRHVLEHIHNPIRFLTMVRRNIGEQLNTALYFEVPNFSFTLRELAIWDIIYEHCSYFNPKSFVQLFNSCGFIVSNITETFGEQWLAIEARPVENVNFTKVSNAEGSGNNIEDILNFANRFQKKIESWQKRLERIKKTGQRAVVWGAGAKGVSFLNMLNNQDRIEYVVDVNPRKQGMYIAGTGQEILSPNFIQNYNPDIIIVMNDFYQREIQQIVHDLGVKAELLCA